MTDGILPVCAAVVATRGGRHLRAALDAVGWAAERTVVDALGVVRAGDLPASVALERDVAAVGVLGAAPWLLLQSEHEVWTPGSADAVAMATAGPAAAYRPVVELVTLGTRLRLRTAGPRLAPRAGCGVAFDRALDLRLTGPHAVRSFEAMLEVRGGESVADAFAALEADGTLLPVLLAQLGGAPGGVVGGPLAALGRVLGGRAERPAGLARWVAAVFAAYRVVLGQARWWEWRHAQPAAVEEIG
jgi:hypothetical protein